MTNNALVSIIVPVYGTEAYLPACIESLCKQTYPHIEIILVDDQSPDSCPEICDRYAAMDPRIKVIHQKNNGVSGARNAGIDAATGEYFCFVDSDDILYPEAVELLLQDAFDYDADVVSAVKRSVDADGSSQNTRDDGALTVYREDEPLLLSLAGDRNTNSACAKLFKTSFVQGLRYEEGKNIHEDGFFLFRCYLRKPLLIQHNVPVYQYNTREGSGSRQSFSEKYLAMLYFCDRKKELIAENYPQYTEQAANMEVRTNLLFLMVLCRPSDKKYKEVQRKCIQTVRRLREYHKPVNSTLKKLEKIVTFGLFPLYKMAFRMKFYK